MNAFKVFATMSLVDAISKPLAFIKNSLAKTEGSVNNLSNRLGKLATGFGKVAVASGVFLASLGVMVDSAIAFESKMADVAKVVDFESPAELKQMSLDLQDLSLQIPIAAEGFADIVAAAAQSGVAKDDLKDFSVQAAKMGVAFDIAAGEASKTMADWRAGMGLTLEETYSLADAVNHLANNMNATAPEISQVLNRMGAVGKAAGFTETELAALAATGLSAGATADIVGTGFNSIFSTLTQGSSMVDSTKEAFKTLGYDAESLAKSMQMDAKGTILDVLESIADLPKDLQLSIITSAFGQQSLKTIAPMVGNLDNLRQAFGLVGDAANYAGSMEAEYTSRSATTENSIQLMKNSFNVLAITVGSIFLPVIDTAAKGISSFTGLLVKLGRSEAGAFILKMAAGIATALVGTTGLITAFAILKPVILMIGGALSAVLWPVLLIGGAVALVALAWKKDFLGIATTITNFATKVKLVFQGVLAVFRTLKDGKGELSGELAKNIEAAGLTGLVTTVSRVIFRIMTFFKGLAQGAKEMLSPALGVLGAAFDYLKESVMMVIEAVSGVTGSLGTAAASTGTSKWAEFGRIAGKVVAFGLSALVTVLGVVIGVIGGVVRWVLTVVRAFISFTSAIGGAITKAIEFARGVKASLEGFAAHAMDIFARVMNAIHGFSLIDAGTALIDGFISGIQAAAGKLTDAVSGIFSKVREFLPFSDAKTGPFSNLTASGMAFIETIKDGIMAKAGVLVDSVKGVLSSIRDYLPFSDAKVGPLSRLTASGMAVPGTLAQGVRDGAPALVSATDKMMGGLNLAAPSMNFDGLAPDFYTGFNVPSAPSVEYLSENHLAGGHFPPPRFDFVDEAPEPSSLRSGGRSGGTEKIINLHIGNITLPNVKDSDDFLAALEAIATERI